MRRNYLVIAWKHFGNNMVTNNSDISAIFRSLKNCIMVVLIG